MLDNFMAIASTVITLLLVIAIFVGAYYFSKFVAGSYQKNNPYGKNMIEILERKYIGKDQSLMVVKISDKIIFLSATANNINEIATFTSEDFDVINTENPHKDLNENTNKTFKENFTDNFKDVLARNLNNKSNDKE